MEKPGAGHAALETHEASALVYLSTILQHYLYSVSSHMQTWVHRCVKLAFLFGCEYCTFCRCYNGVDRWHMVAGTVVSDTLPKSLCMCDWAALTVMKIIFIQETTSWIFTWLLGAWQWPTSALFQFSSTHPKETMPARFDVHKTCPQIRWAWLTSRKQITNHVENNGIVWSSMFQCKRRTLHHQQDANQQQQHATQKVVVAERGSTHHWAEVHPWAERSERHHTRWALRPKPTETVCG